MTPTVITELDKNGLLACIPDENDKAHTIMKKLLASANTFEDLQLKIAELTSDPFSEDSQANNERQNAVEEYFKQLALTSTLETAVNEYKMKRLSREYNRLGFIVNEISVSFPDKTTYKYHEPRLFKYRELLNHLAPGIAERSLGCSHYDKNTVTIESMFGLDDDSLALAHSTISFYDLMIFLEGKVTPKKEK